MRHPTSRRGFTLIEVLMVIGIIGILVGLLVPAVNIAMKSVKQNAIALEVQALSSAVEQYNQKFGEYPPDGADPALVTRHLRKVFPQIATSELALLDGSLSGYPSGNLAAAEESFGISTYGGTGRGVMDPAEALVFFLGGFSNNPQFPLSGKGGPFFIIGSDGSNSGQVNSSGAFLDTSGTASSFVSVQYNTDRTGSLHEFKQDQLTLTIDGGFTVSNDENTLSNGSFANDLLPCYHPPGLQAPFVYFDSRTYQQTTVASIYSTTTNGLVYPYRSTQINTKVDKSNAAVANRNKYFKFLEEKSFQLISAGLDDNYGGVSGQFFMYRPAGSENGGVDAKSGDSLDLVGAIASTATHPTPSYVGFRGPNNTFEQLDNVANFADGTFENSLDN